MEPANHTTEGKRIAKLFSDWYTGKPWTYVKMTDILQDITPEMATKHWIPGANSIWQLVQHCVGWRENVLLKLQGQTFQSPEDNYLAEPTDTSPRAWMALLERLQKNEKEWESFLQEKDDASLQAGYAPSKNEYTQYEVIHGILHHDNYHFGQIIMLKKLAQAE